MEEQALTPLSKRAERVLEYLKDHRSITPIEAFTECDCGSLSTAIRELEEHGYEIRTRSESYKNVLGGETSYTRYILV